MEINRKLTFRALLPLGLVIFVAGCVSSPAPPPPPPPTPKPVRTAAPPPPPPAPQVDWRDAPLTAGDWSYRPDGTGSVAAYGEPGSNPLLLLRCDRARRQVMLDRAGSAPAALPMTLLTTSMVRPLDAVPLPGALPMLRATFAASDPALDAMAFSRGRIAVEVNGLHTLIVPAWEEIDRVIEDCR
ncbi:hypothetical protein RXV95_04195 [Novosphingobium sp. ZN18A2]|uniref:hypothetical protein n=1 Tax=Novosphingobium sp. ZN18A2 TaxID=3079861 RepID=UPI0030CEAB18